MAPRPKYYRWPRLWRKPVRTISKTNYVEKDLKRNVFMPGADVMAGGKKFRNWMP
jgi:hypothetical protein